MVTVAVNGHPIQAVTVERQGRVLLSLRTTFAALGATVHYAPDGRVIVARTADRTVLLTIGSTLAQIDGKPVRLDVPAQIVASSTFVPLRFVAQAFGAVVGYDARDNLIMIDTLAFSPDNSRVNVTERIPAPNSQVPTEYPNVTASLAGTTATRDDVDLTIDGTDVTAQASFDGNTITYLPRTAMLPGSHTIAFNGKTVDGSAFSSKWSFTTAGTPPSDQSYTPTDYGYHLAVNGPAAFRSGDWMHFTLVAPPGGSAYLQFCNLGYNYALWNGGFGNTYIANVPAPYGYWNSSCPVQAVYTAWTGQQYIVPFPLYVGLFTSPQPYPAILGPSLAPQVPGTLYAPLPPDRRRDVPVMQAVNPGTKPGSKPVMVPVPKVRIPPPMPVVKPVMPVSRPVRP